MTDLTTLHKTAAEATAKLNALKAEHRRLEDAAVANDDFDFVAPRPLRQAIKDVEVERSEAVRQFQNAVEAAPRGSIPNLRGLYAELDTPLFY